MSRVLVMGGTGAMGRYMVPELVKIGHSVDVLSLDKRISDDKNLSYMQLDAMNDEVLGALLKNRYDAIVDFMTYTYPVFKNRIPLLLDHTDQYIFLSSCRVYANEDPVVKETSPRLLDVSNDQEYLKLRESEYSLFKAMEEDALTHSSYKNWTITRPATTYSTLRAQLVTLEANTFVSRALRGKPVILPASAMKCPATLSWGGDVGKMLAKLVGKKAAIGQDYIVSTSEYNTWEQIAKIYEQILGLRYEWVDMETYLRAISDANRYIYSYYQLAYARMFHRITDNRKILNLTGMKQEELMPLRDGLALELKGVKAEDFSINTLIENNMDAFFTKKLRK